jgi:hypothetical protein
VVIFHGRLVEVRLRNGGFCCGLVEVGPGVVDLVVDLSRLDWGF